MTYKNIGLFSRYLILILILPLLGAGCGFLGGGGATDGGVYVSTNIGKSWEQKVFVGQDKNGAVTIANLNVTKLVARPLNPKIIFAVGGESGIYMTENGGDKWKQFFKLSASNIALHPTREEVIYVSSGNRIWRTLDSGANWAPVYVDITPDSYITDLVVTATEPNAVYATTNRGAILKGTDNGERFQPVYFFKDKVSISRLLLMGGSNTMYVAQVSGALWRSADWGVKWQLISDAAGMKQKVSIGDFRAISALPGVDELLYATSYGIFHVSAAGTNWESLALLTPPRSVDISTLLAHPTVSSRIYYTASRTLYRSSDAGHTWQTLPLPSKRVPASILVSGSDEVLYLGFSK